MQESRKRLKTKRIIQEALIELLQEQAFNQISTVHLTKQAKISRSSFYTHYRDKYDLIDRYQRDLFQQFEYIFETYGEDKREAIIRTLKLVREERLVTALLSENGTKEIQNFLRHKLQILMDEDLRVRYGDKTFTPAEKEYSSIYLSHAVFGVIQAWLTKGANESPEFITDFLIKMLF